MKQTPCITCEGYRSLMHVGISCVCTMENDGCQRQHKTSARSETDDQAMQCKACITQRLQAAARTFRLSNVQPSHSLTSRIETNGRGNPEHPQRRSDRRRLREGNRGVRRTVHHQTAGQAPSQRSPERSPSTHIFIFT